MRVKMYACKHVCMHACMLYCMHVSMHAIMYSSIFACMHACTHVCVYACLHVCMYAFMYACMQKCMHVSMYAFMFACKHVCMHAGMYACMHVCVYACMYACIHVCIDVCMCAFIAWCPEKGCPKKSLGYSDFREVIAIHTTAKVSEYRGPLFGSPSSDVNAYVLRSAVGELLTERGACRSPLAIIARRGSHSDGYTWGVCKGPTGIVYGKFEVSFGSRNEDEMA